MAPGTDPYEPLRRSHAVTLALWFKREVVKAAYEFEHTPNNAKSWALLELKLRKLFDNIYEAGGLEERAEILLGRTTTSANDIKAGKLNIIINFIPVNILREININLNVIGIGETNTIEAVVGGGI
jgi:phage tail sheath protein FI